MKRILVAITIGILLVGATYTLGWSKVLPVKSIEIFGTAHTEVVSTLLGTGASRMYLGEPIARVNIPALKKKLNNSSWISSTTIRRDWLRGVIEIDITERIPVAQFSPRSGELVFFDDAGVEFIPIGNTPKLPIINFTTSDIEARKSVATLVKQLPADLLSSLQAMTVASIRSIKMTSKIGSHIFTIEWGGATDIASKIKVLRALLTLPENAKSSLFNLSSPDSPVVK